MKTAQEEWFDLADKSKICRRLSPDAVLRHKRSNVLYVCATGASVSDLPSNVLAGLLACDTIGINGWVSHPFVPTLYVTESGNMRIKENSDYLVAMARRSASYRDTPFIVKDVDYSGENPFEPNMVPKTLWPNIIVSRERMINGGSRSDISAWLKEHLMSGRMKSDFCAGIVPKRRGTAVYATMLGFLMGYKEIVLIGVDIVSGRHFYDGDNPDKSVEQHFCERADLGIPISQVFLGMKDALFAGENCKLTAVFPSPAFNGEIEEHKPGETR